MINSGTIRATGGGYGASVIGKGGNRDSTKSVTINGGVITTTLKDTEQGAVELGGGSMTVNWKSGDCTVTYPPAHTLTVTGSGNGFMADYSENTVPWAAVRESVTLVVLQSGVTGIGNYAFNGFTKLTSLSLGDTLTRIGKHAFDGCTGLTGVTIPNNIIYWVTRIEDAAFSGCTKLTGLTFSRLDSNGSLTIGSAAFSGVPSVLSYSGEGSYILYNGDTALDEGAALTDLENETLTWRANPAAGKDIRFGASVLAENRNTANAATVYYGGNPWRVIGYNGAGAAGQSGYMTLLAAANMGTSKFDANGNTRKKYKDSTLKNAIDDIAYAHTVAERIAMERRDLAAGSYAGADTDCVEGSTVYSCLCWPLSTKEANAVDGALLNVGEAWWLRSPGDGDNNVGYVTHYGLVDEIGVSYLKENGVRPTFNVDLDSIAFASPAAGGKQGDGVLTAVGGYTGSEWKLTLFGSSRWFTVNETAVSAQPGKNARLTYTRAETGENEYISVIVLDADGAPRYYARVAQPDAASGTVEIPIPADFAEGTYTLKVFNEQYNGDCKTDVISAFSDVTLTVRYGNGKALQLVENGSADNLAGAQKSNVWFGNYLQSLNYKTRRYNIDPIQWRVLSNADGRLFLLADRNLEVVRYHEWEANVTWETCSLRKWLNGYEGHPFDDTFIGSAFTGDEAGIIADTAVKNDDNPDYGTPGGADTTDKVFLLSIADVTNADYGFTHDGARAAGNTDYALFVGVKRYGEGDDGSTPHYWWLRSPGDSDVFASVVDWRGSLESWGLQVNDIYSEFAVRPALNVDLGKVLFTSRAEGGKQGEGLAAVPDYDGSDWKLTVLDGSRAGFTAFCTGVDSGVYTIRYSGAKTGANEKISAMIVDADGSVTYYGVLCDAAAGTNTVTVDANGKLHESIPCPKLHLGVLFAYLHQFVRYCLNLMTLGVKNLAPFFYNRSQHKSETGTKERNCNALLCRFRLCMRDVGYSTSSSLMMNSLPRRR